MWNNAIRLAGWLTLWALLFWISRANHPTSTLNVAATTLMILAAIAAFAVILQTSRNASAAFKFGTAAFSVIGAGILAALAIGIVYDIEIGPNPRRFGLAANIVMDTVVVAALVMLMSAFDWGLNRLGFKNAN